jgi:hypothetical protein
MKMPVRSLACSLSSTTMQAGMPVPYKEVRRQADDALDITLADDPLTDLGLDIAPEEHAMGLCCTDLPNFS